MEQHAMTATQQDGVRQMQNGDPIWERICNETRDAAAAEPILASFLHATILNHEELECALSFHLANLLDSPTAPAMMLREVILEALRDDGDPRRLAQRGEDARVLRLGLHGAVGVVEVE